MLGRFGTPGVVDALADALDSKIVTASNARYSLTKIANNAPDPEVRRKALAALEKTIAK